MRKGFTALVDKQGNQISVPDYKVDRMVKAGWRRLSDPPKPKPETKFNPETTGSK